MDSRLGEDETRDSALWSVVRVPTVIEEDNRRLHRERSRLINERIQHDNRIKGLLAIHGIYDYEPMHPERMQRLELVLGMIKTIETERDAIASAKSKPQQTSAKKIKHLVKLKSIGPEFATVLVGEVFYRTFDNRKQVGSYVGLTPSPFQSGSTSRDQGISRAGNAKARTTMIELAWLWLRNQPGSPLSIWFRERVGNRKGR